MLRKLRPRCLACQSEVPKARMRFCNNRCQSDHQHRLFIEQWKLGMVSGVQGAYSVSNHIRRFLKEKHGEKCQRCGWCERNPVTGRVPLQVEHIDGQWHNCSEENLMLLCPNCHSLTPTFGNLNRGNGRSARYSKKQDN